MAPNPCPALCSAVVWVAVASVSVWSLWPSVLVGWLFSIVALNHCQTYPSRWCHAVVVFQNLFPNQSHQIGSSQTLDPPDCCCISDCMHQMNRKSYWQHCRCRAYSANSNRYCTDSKWLLLMVQSLQWMKTCFSPSYCYPHRICHYKQQKERK